MPTGVRFEEMMSRTSRTRLRSVRRLGRPLRRSSPALDRAMTHRETAYVMTQDPVMIFSMGKTGTSSIAEALDEATNRPVVKAHALTQDGLDRRFAKAERLGIHARPRFLWQCEQISRSLDGHKPWKLLCGVRDPVAVAVSDHFYGLARQVETGKQPWMTGGLDGHALAIAKNIEENFIDRDWFVDELEVVTGIDAYSSEFSTTDGATTLHGNGYCALVVRMENLESVGPQAVAEHFQIGSPLALAHRNQGRSSAASPYRQFLSEGVLPQDTVSAAYRTPMARHFYSAVELDTFRQRWTEG